jgi:hypothetical protein
MLKLPSNLSTWEPTGRLILELNASSSRDSEHWFKNHCFGPGHEDIGEFTDAEKAINWHDPKHVCVHGQQVKAPATSAIRRLFSSLFQGVPRGIPVTHAERTWRDLKVGEL